MELDRRSFLKAGALGALVLAAGGGIYRATRAAAPAPFVLEGEVRAALDAIVPALLAGALPSEPGARQAAIAATAGAVQGAIAGLPLAAQKQLGDLFGMLALAPARRVLTGIAGSWRAARESEVAAFLENWRLHRFSLLRSAYAALHDLVLGSWYAQPASWAAIGYPGPMKELA